MDTLSKKYGLWTSIALVVGVVIGSGVFFKADDVLIATEGNITMALLAWIVGAISMIFGALVFAEFAHRIQKSNGIVDYFEEAYGDRMGYLIGWFKGVLYYAPLSAILAWASAMYTLTLFNCTNANNTTMTWVLALIYLIIIYCVNYFAPVIAGRLQVTTMVVKLIPLTLIAVVGIISGLINGVLIENFVATSETLTFNSKTWTGAVVATAFAYEGWIVATTINSEIKDSKKNLPKALTIGAIIIFLVYISYFLGITGVLSTEQIMAEGDGAVAIAAKSLFGNVAGVLLTAFVVVSCLGTLNGLSMSCIRVPYSLSVRNQGPAPKLLSRVNEKTNMPTYSAIYAFSLSLIYLILWYASLNEWFGKVIALDEIPIVLIYGLYILLYVWYMIKFKDLGIWKRYVIPTLAIIGSLVILYGGITKPSIGLYIIISVLVLLSGFIFYRKQ